MIQSGSSIKNRKYRQQQHKRTDERGILQKYQVGLRQGKESYQAYLSKNQKKLKSQNMYKSHSKLVPQSMNVHPQSIFQKKIRQAIEIRFKKSKIKDFKYKSFQKQTKQDKKRDEMYQVDEWIYSDDSQKSQDMEQMRQFVYLKNQISINIYQYHTEKIKYRSQLPFRKERSTKKKLRYINCKAEHFQRNSQNIYHCEVDSKDFQSNSQDPKNQVLNDAIIEEGKKQNSRIEIIKMNESSHQNMEAQKRKSLTSRQTNNQQYLEYYQNKKIFQNSPKNTAIRHYKIKDTFKLKNVNKFISKRDDNQINSPNINPDLTKQQNNQKSSRSDYSKGRRYLLHNNLKQQKKLKTEPIQEISQNTLMNNFCDSLNKSKQKKTSSLRKIQTQLNSPYQSSIKHPVTNKTPKNYHKNYKSNFIKYLNDKSENKINSLSEQKWKLQQISFKFKTIDEQKTQNLVNPMEIFIEQKEKAIKLGLSLEKAYQKLLSQRNNQKKQAQYLNNKKTVTKQKEQKVQSSQKYLNESQKQRNQRSKQKNRRRKLRLRTQSDHIYSSLKNGQNKISPHTQIKQNSSKSSLDSQKQQRIQFFRNMRKTKNTQRFSTII